EGTMLYTLSQPGTGITAPQRIVRVSDNDAPFVTAWNFTRTGARGEFGTATATVTDNVRMDTASMLLAIDGTASAAASAGANKTLTFSLTAALTEENKTVRIEVRGTDVAGNG